jgi:hypothetical protein
MRRRNELINPTAQLALPPGHLRFQPIYLTVAEKLAIVSYSKVIMRMDQE